MSRLGAALAGAAVALATFVLASPAAVAAEATRLTVTMPATVNPDQPVTVIVTAVDNTGGRDFNYQGTIRFTSSDEVARLPADYTFTAQDGGEHRFDDIVFRQQGIQTLRVTDTARPTITGQAETRVGNATTQALRVAFPNGARHREPATVVVTAINNFGAVDTNYRGSVHFTSTDNIATLPPDYQFTAADAGQRTFTNGVVFRTTGPQRVHVQDAASPNIYGDFEVVIGTYPTPTADDRGGLQGQPPPAQGVRPVPQLRPPGGVTPAAPAVRSAVNRRGTLPFTGAEIQRLAAIGVALLCAGMLMVAGRKLRRASQT